MDVVIHLAEKVHDTKNQAEAQECFDINTGLTQKVYDYFLASEASKFIFLSSVKAAADRIFGGSLNEMVVPEPKGPYGESKLLAEQYLHKHWPDKEAGKTVYIVRPCMLHGPGYIDNLNFLYRLVRKGIPWPLGIYENQQSFTSIDNLCFIVNGLIRQPVASGIYHISDDESLSTSSLIQLMGQLTGKKTRLWHLPVWFVKLVVMVGIFLYLPFDPERLAKLTDNYLVDNTKIKQALGTDRLPVSVREGLVRTLKSFGRV